MTDAPTVSTGRAGLRGFLAFSHGWTWLFWAIASLWGTSIWRPPALVFFIIGGLGVPLGGLVMSRLTGGAPGLRDLLRRIVDPTRIAPQWWAVVLLFFPALTLVAGALSRASGEAHPLDLAGALARATDPVRLLGLVGFTLIIGPVPEEIGWRGYFLDQLQARRSALAAALMVGLLMWVWHLPLLLLPGYGDAFHMIPLTPLHLAFVVVPAAVLYAWVYNNTDRSVLAVILFHFTGNFSGEFFGISAKALTYRLGLTAILVALIVWWWGPGTLRRNGQPPAPGPRV